MGLTIWGGASTEGGFPSRTKIKWIQQKLHFFGGNRKWLLQAGLYFLKERPRQKWGDKRLPGVSPVGEDNMTHCRIKTRAHLGWADRGRGAKVDRRPLRRSPPFAATNSPANPGPARMISDPQETERDASASDGSLVRRFRCGESDAATALYTRYACRLHAIAGAKTSSDLGPRFDAEDVVQSVFRTFFRRVSTGSYDVPDGDDLWGLLLVVTLNKTRRLALRHRARQRDVRSTAGCNAMLEQEPLSNAPLADLRLVVEEFTESLSPCEREIVELRVEGHEVAEIAVRLRRSKRTIERLLQGIRAGLLRQLDE